MNASRSVVLAAPVRTAIGTFGGTLKDMPATELGAIASAPLSSAPGSRPEEVGTVVMGNVVQAGNKMNPGAPGRDRGGVPVTCRR